MIAIPYSGFFLQDPSLCELLRSCWLADFNSIVTLILYLNSVTVAYVTLLYLVIWLTYVSLQILQKILHFCIAAVPDSQSDLKGPSALISSWRHYSTSLTVTQPNIFINVVSSDRTAYCKGFCFRYYCTCRIWQLLKRSRNLI